MIADELGEQFTFDANEVIIDNSEIAKYLFFVKKGGCMVEFTNENMVYKEPMLAGQVFGFESLVTNVYHSKATANTMAEILQVKKSLVIKILETFPLFEEAFWKNNIFQCYKMFLKKEDISYRISHIQKEVVENMVASFRLRRIDPATIDDPEEDMIFIRGNAETSYKDERSVPQGSNSYKKLSRDKDMGSSFTETCSPFYFVSRLKEGTLRIKEPSIFLVGELDYEVFELESMRLSRNTSWKKTKKESMRD